MLRDCERDLASLAGEGSIFGGSAAEKLKRLQAELRPLSRRYDVVVANPPYMGAKNMNSWLSGWVKKYYADVKGDLFSCFMVRNSGMGADHAQMGFMTPYVWMFIGTYEKLRRFVIEQNTITSLIQLEYSGFAGATVPICTFTLQKGKVVGYKGGYIRLSDFPGADQQAPRALEALADPGCGWFYRADADGFGAIPGSPIAYWASESIMEAFRMSEPLRKIAPTLQGLATGDNDRFLRCWWEVSSEKLKYDCRCLNEALDSDYKWFPMNKGGGYRKWFGNNETVLAFDQENYNALLQSGNHLPSRELYFKEALTWGMITSSKFSMRLNGCGFIFSNAGLACIAGDHETSLYLLGLMNSAVASAALSFIAPTMNYTNGDVGKCPVRSSPVKKNKVGALSSECIDIAVTDWDSFEVSWDYSRHPLLPGMSKKDGLK